MHYDAVFWGSVISIGIAVVIFVYLVFKVKALMDKDAQSHDNR